jgi:hypothetical protein
VLVYLAGSIRGEDVKDDSCIKLNDKEWRAHISHEHLQLVCVERTDDKRAKATAKREHIANEIEMRTQEVAALEAQRSVLIAQCEEVVCVVKWVFSWCSLCTRIALHSPSACPSFVLPTSI